ncbi:MAG: hypothetical protein AAGU19_04235 [Prolixibacteraceae bacterium]
MKRLIMSLMLLTGTVVSGLSNPVVPAKENLKGTWEYKAPEAPYEYNAGKFVFDEVDGKPVVTVKARNGAELKARDVKVENDSISFTVMIDYEQVKVTGKISGNKLTGKAAYSEGVLNVTAEKSALKTN